MSNIGLGRGLDSLLPKKDVKDTALKNIPVDKIEPNPNQPREEFDPEKMEELTQSIQNQGVIEPVVLQPEQNDSHTLIAGERRWRAACQAELESIPAIIKDVTAEQSLSVALIENIQRENLNSIEEAQAYNQLKEKQDLSQEEVAKLVGKNRTTIANRLRLLNLPDTIKDALIDEDISPGHARALLSIGEDEQKEKVLEKIIENDLNVRQAENLIKSRKSEDKKENKDSGKQKTKNKKPAHFENLESDLEETIGAPVGIKSDKERKSGHIKIFFNDPDEFEMIRKRLEQIQLED